MIAATVRRVKGLIQLQEEAQQNLWGPAYARESNMWVRIREIAPGTRMKYIRYVKGKSRLICVM